MKPERIGNDKLSMERGQKQMTSDDFDRFIRTLPRHFHGPNAQRVIRNLANGGARLRTFMRTDAPSGFVMREFARIADMFGAKSRTVKSRTSLGILALHCKVQSQRN